MFRIRICTILGLPDPDPSIIKQNSKKKTLFLLFYVFFMFMLLGLPDPDPSIIKQNNKKNFISTVLCLLYGFWRMMYIEIEYTPSKK